MSQAPQSIMQAIESYQPTALRQLPFLTRAAVLSAAALGVRHGINARCISRR